MKHTELAKDKNKSKIEVNNLIKSSLKQQQQRVQPIETLRSASKSGRMHRVCNRDKKYYKRRAKLCAMRNREQNEEKAARLAECARVSVSMNASV